MLRFAMKALNRWRRIYYLSRHGKRLSGQPLADVQTVYNEAPIAAAVVQLFNKRRNIEAIVGALKNSAFDEVVVLDDGSSDGAIDILPGLLCGKNHFIIRSNDLFEVRTYSRFGFYPGGDRGASPGRRHPSCRWSVGPGRDRVFPSPSKTCRAGRT
jgi:hypothetical protein